MASLFKYEFDANHAVAYLVDLGDKAADLSPLMANIGRLLEASARDRIEATNTTPEGVPWPVSLRAQEDGGKTLFEKGRLAASLHNIPDRNSVEVGSNLIYAGVHQDGATILPVNGDALVFKLANGRTVTVGSVTIPARPYLGVSEQDAADIDKAVAHYLGTTAVPQ